MDKEELVNLVKRIQSAEGTEEEIDQMIDLFTESVPDPNAVDYIFEIEYDGMSAEEIVSKSLSYVKKLLG